MDYILSIIILACINMVAVLGLAIFTGFTGLFSLGHAAFVGVGAYTSSILTYYYFVPFYIALPAGAAAAGLVSLVIGVPTLRAKLRSDYFAIAIMGFGEALRVLLENLEITNGARGLPGIDGFTTLPIVLLCLSGGVIIARNFLKSRWGAACIAIREDPVAAEMAGVRLFRTRLLSLAVSAVYCGLSGGAAGALPVLYTARDVYPGAVYPAAGGGYCWRNGQHFRPADCLLRIYRPSRGSAGSPDVAPCGLRTSACADHGLPPPGADGVL